MFQRVIPIVSYESEVDIDNFGILLNECSIEPIKTAIKEIFGLPVKELQYMSRKAWEYAREKHTREGVCV